MGTRRTSWARAHRAELAAAVIGVLLVLGAAAALRAGGSAHARHIQSRSQTTRARITPKPTRASAIQAAANYLLALGHAAVASPQSARQTVDSITTGLLQAELGRSLQTLAGSLRARVKDARAPATLDGWPLGYRLLSFQGSRAMVAVWHLDIASSSALRLLSVGYATTTYRLRFIAGAWRIEAATSPAGPTPPATDTSTRQLNSFARAANSFSPYRCVP
jgi:hypothetical protein